MKRFFPIFQYFNRAVFAGCYTECHVSLTRPRETKKKKKKISLGKPREIVNDLRLIYLETFLAYNSENVVFSAHYRDRTNINQDDGHFLFFAACVTIHYYHELPSSGLRILRTLSLAVLN